MAKNSSPKIKPLEQRTARRYARTAVHASEKHTKSTGDVSQTSIPRILLLTSFMGCLYFGSQLATVQTMPYVPAPLNMMPTENTSKPELVSLPASEPQRLIIPDIGVDSGLTAIGLNTDGTLEVPKRYDTAGFYKNGPSPGEVGPAIIVGHVSNKNGKAVFWRLSELKEGQIIEINRKDGLTAKFKVDKVQLFSQDAFPEQEVYGPINYSGLRLITCGGTYNKITHRYSHNTVVFARLVT